MTEPAVVYVRMAPALRDTLRERADADGVSLNAYVVHALAAAAGPEFLRRASEGGKPRTVTDDRRVRRRPEPARMGGLVAEYVDYWVGKLGMERLGEIGKLSDDHDLVWAWWLGHQAELEALRESTAGRSSR